MSGSPFDDVLVLTGPTGSGKSSLAMTIADRLRAEIISMDSMTLYRGMDIGTAKASPSDRALIPHHLIDVLDPWESANVAWWREHAIQAVTEIRGRGRVPLFVGGTPFYLMAVLYGLFDGPPADDAIRDRLDQEASEIGLAALHQRLSVVDPIASQRIHPNDQKRIVRALEVFESTGRLISDRQTTWNSPNFSNDAKMASVRACRIDWPREVLYQRIDQRVREMIDAGWKSECERLLTMNQPLSREAEKAIGYREWFEVIRNPSGTTADVESLIALRTRQFAKRQLTWFRRMAMIPVMMGDQTDLSDRVFECLTR